MELVFFDTKYKQLKMYNESWDYLMPIVDKIEHLYETEKSLPVFDINSHHARFAVSYPFKYKNWIVGIGAKSAEKIKADSKIEATWMVVVEFIKWYNETNKKS